MNDKIVSTEIEKTAEDKNLTIVKSFDELLGCRCVTYLNNVLTFEYILLDFEMYSVFFTEIKKEYSEIKELHFIGCTFSRNISAQGSIIEYSLDFENAKFGGEANFRNAKFGGEANFGNAKFDNGISFHYCNLNNTIKFEGILFPIENNNNELSFDNCSFNSDSIVIFQDIASNNYKIAIENTTIRGGVIMRNIKADSLSLKDSIVTGTISLADNVDFKKTIGRRTDCILKHEALKINDNVDFLKYRKREHIKILRHWLVKEESKPYWFFKTTRNYWNCFMEFWVVFLNLISNNFGQSWILGIGFTVVFAMLFVAILQVKTGDIVIASSIKEAWDYFPTFMNDVSGFIWLPNMLSEESKKMASASMTIFVLGKILVGFGIYQTIAAFRRHGK